MMDSGGSSGFLRDEYGILPPGDFMRCILALSPMPQHTRKVFLHRFKNGDTLSNLIYTAAREQLGSDEETTNFLNKHYNVRGTVLPVTLDHSHLHARLEDGTMIEGETNIDIRKDSSNSPIKEVWLDPPAGIFYKAADALVEADLIVFGPGDLYTSVIPNILVKEFTDLVHASNARKVYVCNLFTKYGETDNYDASDFLDAIEKYLGPEQIDTLILHHNGFSPGILEQYANEKANPVQYQLHKIQERGVEFIVQNLATETIPIRHNSEKLAEVILDYLV